MFLGDFSNESDTGDSFYTKPIRYFSLIVSSLGKNFSPGMNLIAAQNSQSVYLKSAANLISHYYYENKLRLLVNSDYFVLKDRAYDQDAGSDYFLLLTSYNLMPFNGTLYRYAVKHEKVHTGHNLMDLAPYSGKNNKWEAALPYGMQWQFDSLQKIKNTASGSQTFDWATWKLSEPDGSFINTFSLFVPASAWFIPEAAPVFLQSIHTCPWRSARQMHPYHIPVT